MPIYTYQDTVSGKSFDIIRSIKEPDALPLWEEARVSGMTEEEFGGAKWRKLLGNFTLTKGRNWGPGKGNWLVPLILLPEIICRML